MNVRILPADIRARVPHRGVAMLGVPDDVRREQDQGGEPGHDAAAAFQRLPRLARDKRVTGDAEYGVDHRLFGEKAEPDRNSEQDGEAHALPLHQHHPEIERDAPEQDQRDVGRDQQRGIGDARQRVEDDGRPEAHTLVEQRAPREERHHRGERVEHRRGRPDAGLTVPADCGRPTDQPGDHRGLGEIAEGEIARPRPILGLVEDEVRLGGVDRGEPQSEQRAETSDKRKEVAGPGKDARVLRHDKALEFAGRRGGLQCCAARRKLVTGAPIGADLPRSRGQVHAYFRCYSGI